MRWIHVNENAAALAPASKPAVKYILQLPASLGVRNPTIRPPITAERKKYLRNLSLEGL